MLFFKRRKEVSREAMGFTVTPVPEHLEDTKATEVASEAVESYVKEAAFIIDQFPPTIKFVGEDMKLTYEKHSDGEHWWGYEAEDGSFIGFTDADYLKAAKKLLVHLKSMRIIK